MRSRSDIESAMILLDRNNTVLPDEDIRFYRRNTSDAIAGWQVEQFLQQNITNELLLDIREQQDVVIDILRRMVERQATTENMLSRIEAYLHSINDNTRS